MDFKKLIKNCEEFTFDVDFDYGNEQVTVFKAFKGISYEFVVYYTKEIKNHRNASYMQPSEGDVDFYVTDISELSLYDPTSRLIDLSDDELEIIYKIIKNSIKNNL